MAMTYQRIGVIMAGGSGERFWPLSRQARPKQLLPLTGPDQSMLGEAVARLACLMPPDRIYVITGRALVEPIRAANVGVPAENVVAEPCKRNTSGALAYIAAHLLATLPNADPAQISLAVTTADHRIGDVAAFCAAVNAAMEAAESRDALVVCGIPPRHAETGFGYIQTAPGDAAGVVRPVCAFHEKPDRETARAFVASGDYFWNSGMFFWKLGAFLQELDTVRPALSAAVRLMTTALRAGKAHNAETAFAALEDISIDYALMEHAHNVWMVRGDFPWEDVGAWPALDAVLPRDVRGNVLRGNPILVDCEDCVVFNDVGDAGMAVGVVGLRGMVVVATQDAVLVMPKERAQEVRRIVAELKTRGAAQL